MKSLLKQYVRMVIETLEHDQSVATDTEEKSGDENDEITEFSSAGAVAGFTAPLGASSENFKFPRPERNERH